LQEALDKLLVLEKQARNVSLLSRLTTSHSIPTDHSIPRPQASDLSSTSRVLISTITLLFSLKDYPQLNAYLQILSKKHGQLRQAVQKMVDAAMEFVGQLEGEDKLKLIETLREITEGKVRFPSYLSTLTSSVKAERGEESGLLTIFLLLRSTSKSPAPVSPASSPKSKSPQATSTPPLT
jgi:26S proteasome regulatory subunit N5